MRKHQSRIYEYLQPRLVMFPIALGSMKRFPVLTGKYKGLMCALVKQRDPYGGYESNDVQIRIYKRQINPSCKKPRERCVFCSKRNYYGTVTTRNSKLARALEDLGICVDTHIEHYQAWKLF